MDITIPFREFSAPHPLTNHIQRVERYLSNLEHLVQTFQQVKTRPDLDESHRESFEKYIRKNFDQVNHFITMLPSLCTDSTVQSNLQQKFSTRLQQLWWQHQGIAPPPSDLISLGGELRDLQGLLGEASLLIAQQEQLVSNIETNLTSAREHVAVTTTELEREITPLTIRQRYLKAGLIGVVVGVPATLLLLLLAL